MRVHLVRVAGEDAVGPDGGPPLDGDPAAGEQLLGERPDSPGRAGGASGRWRRRRSRPGRRCGRAPRAGPPARGGDSARPGPTPRRCRRGRRPGRARRCLVALGSRAAVRFRILASTQVAPAPARGYRGAPPPCASPVRSARPATTSTPRRSRRAGCAFAAPSANGSSRCASPRRPATTMAGQPPASAAAPTMVGAPPAPATPSGPAPGRSSRRHDHGGHGAAPAAGRSPSARMPPCRCPARRRCRPCPRRPLPPSWAPRPLVRERASRPRPSPPPRFPARSPCRDRRAIPRPGRRRPGPLPRTPTCSRKAEFEPDELPASLDEPLPEAQLEPEAEPAPEPAPVEPTPAVRPRRRAVRALWRALPGARDGRAARPGGAGHVRRGGAIEPSRTPEPLEPPVAAEPTPEPLSFGEVPLDHAAPDPFAATPARRPAPARRGAGDALRAVGRGRAPAAPGPQDRRADLQGPAPVRPRLRPVHRA